MAVTVKKAAEDLANAEQQKPGPFQSNYGDKIQGLLDTILNRGKFTYDFNADPIYQQYAQRYQEQGQQAMKDTMAQAAALTGGYGSTYGQSVGQQTYQQYLQQLNDKIPELRQAAYQQYQDEGQTLRDNLGMLQGQDDRDYNRYRDDVSDYQTELSYFYNKFSDMSQQEYQRYQNDLAAWQKDRDYWYNKWLAEEELALKKGSGRGGGGGRRSSKTEQYVLKSTTQQGAAKELANAVKQGKLTSAEAAQIAATQIPKLTKGTTPTTKTDKGYTGATR